MSEKICKEIECNRKYHTRGYCEKHYNYYRRKGIIKPLSPESRKHYCEVEGCDKRVHGQGYCSNHYRLFIKHGDPLKKDMEFHGMSKWPEYPIWNAMKYRTQNPKCEMYHRYGGRGIIVCDRWNKSFPNFMEDMGRRPSVTHQIDRIDNDGNYEPGNCQWVTPSENRKNQPPRVITPEIKEELIKYRKSGMSYGQISKKTGINQSTVVYHTIKIIKTI